jgi:heme iron utilization protein
MAENEELERKGRAGVEAGGGLEAVRGLFHAQRFGVLSTVSRRHPGFPYGTLVPYALDARGAPLLLLSSLAQHTQNLDADPRASLLVFDGEAAARDPRTAARLTLVGRVVRVDAAARADAEARYADRHVGARGLMNLDFAPFVLELVEAQYVGGFAAAAFLTPAELLRSQ